MFRTLAIGGPLILSCIKHCWKRLTPVLTNLRTDRTNSTRLMKEQMHSFNTRRHRGIQGAAAGWQGGQEVHLGGWGREGEIPGAALQAMRRLSSTSASTAPHELTSESLEVFEVALEILQSLDNAAWTLAFIADATTIWPSLNSHSSNLSRWTSRSGGTIIAGRAALH
ncbi:hypothetical protein WJX74_003149 [Apatococcus lobatus]|uniref:Uncharacterized protein n=2 Tax=Apatococcus TaxID=904362 RepID=A0AAW1SGZ5_9CHLO